MKKTKTTVGEWKTNATGQLLAIYPKEEARAVIKLAVEEITCYDSAKQSLMKNVMLEADQTEALNAVLSRLLKNEPLQYVLGHAWFYGLKLQVDRNTLIPRRETEELADWVIRTCKEGSSVLDIGTGSGCIALAVKSFAPVAMVTGWDNNSGAITVARNNAEQLRQEVIFEQKDIFGVAEERRKWDVIVSNPPYVRASEQRWMKPHVLDYEPEGALFVSDTDALLFYDAIARFATDHLTDGGYLFFEINEYLPQEVVMLLEKLKFKDITVKKDMQGKPRMVKALKRTS